VVGEGEEFVGGEPGAQGLVGVGGGLGGLPQGGEGLRDAGARVQRRRRLGQGRGRWLDVVQGGQGGGDGQGGGRGPLDVLRLAGQGQGAPVHHAPQRRTARTPIRVRPVAGEPRRGGLMPGPGSNGGAERETTFDVRIWGVTKVAGARGTTYELRWRVGRKRRSRSFAKKALAESYRSELSSRANRGEAFDVELGVPVSMVPREEGITWWEWAIEFVDLKWPTLAPRSRQALADALCTITMALLSDTPGRPEDGADLRAVMRRWAFVRSRRDSPVPDGLEDAAAWLAKGTILLQVLEQPAEVRKVLDAMALRQDGKPAAATTIARKRAVFFNALEFAVEQGHLEVNALTRIRWKTPKQAAAVDPASMVNPEQAGRLLPALGELAPPGEKRQKAVTLARNGQRLVAFFGAMYYAGLRPSEALALEVDDLDLPATDDEWGSLRVGRSDSQISTAWTDDARREARQLKHRAVGDVRLVPCAPPLVALLRAHLERDDVPSEGRLFSGPRGGPLSEKVYTEVWRAARKRALTRKEAASSLVRRPYDLRHSCVSTWLAAGVDSTQIAIWVGHSVAVLHRVYAHVLPGRDEVNRRRISNVLVE
jgi:integrase